MHAKIRKSSCLLGPNIFGVAYFPEYPVRVLQDMGFGDYSVLDTGLVQFMLELLTFIL